ncbi:hypothetical protein ABZ656_29940 [Streptomyces sp. NPDC007095]|uniref:hypothetical protein n=1 Tax=Streptomyces sp. NPDC007095 TaxID=3154482 RepID=UPI0033E677C3
MAREVEPRVGLRKAARAVADTAPQGTYRVLVALAPLLTEFVGEPGQSPEKP